MPLEVPPALVGAVPALVGLGVGFAANCENASIELKELKSWMVRGCYRSQRLWENGMTEEDLKPLEDTLDRAQVLHNDVVNAAASSERGLVEALRQTGISTTTQSAVKWRFGLYTHEMDEHQKLIDRQIELATNIARSEGKAARQEQPLMGIALSLWTRGGFGVGSQRGMEMEERHWCAWISIDPRSSEVVMYPRSIARFIEYAQQQGRKEVFLGDGFHGARVFLSDDSEFHWQRTRNGGFRSVRRLIVDSPRGEFLHVSVLKDPRTNSYRCACPHEAVQDQQLPSEERQCINHPIEVPAVALVWAPIDNAVSGRLMTARRRTL